jgi:hypothetical protein
VSLRRLLPPRWPTFGELLVLILVLSVGVNVATAQLNESPEPRRAPDQSAEEWVGEMYQQELRAKKRRLDLDGAIGVTDIECADGKRRNTLIPCLAHVAAPGEARKLAPPHVTIEIFFHHPTYFEWDVAKH